MPPPTRRSTPPSPAPTTLEQQAVQTALFRRWLILLLVGSVTIVLLAVGLTLLWRVVFAPTHRADEVVSALGSPEASLRPGKLHSVTPVQLPQKLFAPKPRETSSALLNRETLLEALGSLSVIHLYQSYLNIGMLADAVENETYTRSEAASILQNVAELLNLADVHLGKLAGQSLEPDDQQSLERLRTLSSKLRLQTTTLLSYWTTSAAEQVARYHRLREESWSLLRDILNIEE